MKNEILFIKEITVENSDSKQIDINNRKRLDFHTIAKSHELCKTNIVKVESDIQIIKVK